MPEHWNIIQFRRVVENIKDGTHGTHSRENNGFPLLSAKNVFNDGIHIYDNESQISEDDYKLITSNGFPKKNDLLITCVGSIGRCCIYPFDTPLAFQRSVAFLRLNKNAVPKYYKYFVESVCYQEQLKANVRLSIQGGVYLGTLISLYASLPPIDEQTAIAHYLDTKLGEIDALIGKQQTLLEKLAEQRTAVITHAVTKGLNPAAPMKKSGVEWLGDVPAHWEVKRLRFTLSLNPVKSELNIPEDTLVSFVPMEAVNFDKDLTLSEERNLDEVYKGYTYFKNGDVVLAKITPCFENGKSAIAQNLTNGIAFGTTELHVLRSQDSINNHFLYYLIKSDSFMKIGESEMYGAGGQKRVPEEFIKNFLIGLPPYYEQVTIADYLDQETAKIDDLCDTVNQTIGRLKEYRTALITQAVTGKIKVTDE